MGQPIPQGILNLECIEVVERTCRTETSKYAQEKKATAIPSVAASERGEIGRPNEPDGKPGQRR